MKYLYAFLMLVGFCIALFGDNEDFFLMACITLFGVFVMMVFGSLFVKKIREEEKNGEL